MRVIAKLDAKPPFVVKPVHFEGLRRMGDPVGLAQNWYQQGADELLYIDIVASLYQRSPSFDQVSVLSQGLFIPLGAGGGLRNLQDITRMLHCGADKVTLNTFPLQHNPQLIDQAARTFGSQAVVLSIEAKRHNDWWECYSDCGREPSGKDVLSWVVEAERRGVGEVLVQSVDCDGRRQGFDISLIQAVKQAVSIPVIAASGAGTVEHVVAMACQARPDAVAVSSILHYEGCCIAEIKSALAEEGM